MEALNRRRFFAASALGAAALATHGSAAEPAKPVGNPIAEANNMFNTEMFRQFIAKPGNVFYSSFSIEAAFGMLAAGAQGESLTQLQKAFHLPEAMPNTHAGFKALFAALNDTKVPAEKRGFELAVANALWGASTYPWSKEYIATVTGSYGAGLFDTDFAKPEVARKRINSWVEQQTRDKIKDLLPMGSVTEMTRLVLTNAIYFKGKWELEFDKKRTKDAPFAMAGGKKMDVPMMHKSAGFLYGESETMKAVELPYIGKETSMLVMLPKKVGTLSAIEQKITSKEIDSLIQGLRYEKTVILALPKFKIETDYELSAPLKKLGVTDIFGAKANLKGMHTGGEHLSVTAAVHKAFVEVDEKGTEAAAATGLVVGVTSVQIPKPPKEFKADHPFLFAIRHKPTNTILFFGKVEKF